MHESTSTRPNSGNPLLDSQANWAKSLTKVLQLLYFAFFTGVTVFCLIILYLYFGHKLDSQSDLAAQNIVMNMTYIHAAVAVVFYLVGKYLFDRLLAKDKIAANIEKTVQVSNLSSKAMNLIKTAYILRCALYESIALIGLVILFMAVANGTLYENNIIWLNIITYVIFLFFLAYTFPTKEKVLDLYKYKFLVN